MSQSPSINDREWDLWSKVVENFYELAQSSPSAASALTPNGQDTVVLLAKKAAINSAASVG